MSKLSRDRRAIIFYDLEKTGDWKMLSPAEKSDVKKYCHDQFMECITPHNCDDIDPNSFRGDDAIAYFENDHDCINAGLNFFNRIPELIRRVPYIEHVTISPRVIVFADILSGDYQGAYSGKNLENILPNERDFGNSGSFRIIGNDLWYELNADYKNKFNELPTVVKGKRGDSYKIYEYKYIHDTHQIRKRHLPPFIPKYQEVLYKFFSNNLVARNGLTMSLATKLMSDGKPFTKSQFTKVILNWCRAYLEMTASGSMPEDESWKFKLSYWIKDDNDDLLIYSYSYPKDISCLSFEKGIKVKMGENIVGKCWTSGEAVVISTDDKDYKPLHDLRSEKITAIAAFPVFEPLNKETLVGVLCIDTKISEYFMGKPEELNYLKELLSSFTSNLALATYLSKE